MRANFFIHCTIQFTIFNWAWLPTPCQIMWSRWLLQFTTTTFRSKWIFLMLWRYIMTHYSSVIQSLNKASISSGTNELNDVDCWAIPFYKRIKVVSFTLSLLSFTWPKLMKLNSKFLSDWKRKGNKLYFHLGSWSFIFASRFAEWCKKIVFDLIIHKFLNSKEISHENSVKSFLLLLFYISRKKGRRTSERLKQQLEVKIVAFSNYLTLLSQ